MLSLLDGGPRRTVPFHDVQSFDRFEKETVTHVLHAEGWGVVIDLTVGNAADVLRFIEKQCITLRYRLYTHGTECATLDAYAALTRSLGLVSTAPESAAHQSLIDLVPDVVCPVAPWKAPGVTSRALVRVGGSLIEVDPKGTTDTEVFAVGQRGLALSTSRLMVPVASGLTLEALSGPPMSQRMAFKGHGRVFVGNRRGSEPASPSWVEPERHAMNFFEPAVCAI